MRRPNTRPNRLAAPIITSKVLEAVISRLLLRHPVTAALPCTALRLALLLRIHTLLRRRPKDTPRQGRSIRNLPGPLPRPLRLTLPRRPPPIRSPTPATARIDSTQLRFGYSGCRVVTMSLQCLPPPIHQSTNPLIHSASPHHLLHHSMTQPFTPDTRRYTSVIDESCSSGPK